MNSNDMFDDRYTLLGEITQDASRPLLKVRDRKSHAALLLAPLSDTSSTALTKPVVPVMTGFQESNLTLVPKTVAEYKGAPYAVLELPVCVSLAEQTSALRKAGHILSDPGIARIGIDLCRAIRVLFQSNANGYLDPNLVFVRPNGSAVLALFPKNCQVDCGAPRIAAEADAVGALRVLLCDLASGHSSDKSVGSATQRGSALVVKLQRTPKEGGVDSLDSLEHLLKSSSVQSRFPRAIRALVFALLTCTAIVCLFLSGALQFREHDSKGNDAKG